MYLIGTLYTLNLYNVYINYTYKNWAPMKDSSGDKLRKVVWDDPVSDTHKDHWRVSEFSQFTKRVITNKEGGRWYWASMRLTLRLWLTASHNSPAAGTTALAWRVHNWGSGLSPLPKVSQPEPCAWADLPDPDPAPSLLSSRVSHTS